MLSGERPPWCQWVDKKVQAQKDYLIRDCRCINLSYCEQIEMLKPSHNIGSGAYWVFGQDVEAGAISGLGSGLS